MRLPVLMSGLSVVLIGFLSSPVSGQVNLKTGYHIAFFTDRGLDRIMEMASTKRPYDKAFPMLHWMHGLDAGIRWKSGMHGLEVSYHGGFRSLSANGVDATTMAAFTDKISFASNAIGAGYQVSGNGFGIGAEYQWAWMRTKGKFEAPDQSMTHVQPMRQLLCYMLFVFEGNRHIDMGLKPFVQLPGSSYDAEPLRAFTGAEVNAEGETWTRFGISIIFYNGDKGN